MKRDLPSVYSNPINKEIKNNTMYYYGSLESERKVDKNINQVINNIFASKDFVYKKKIRVTTLDDVLDIVLVGRNSNSLLTLDNKSIPISSIVDIEM